MRKPLAIDPGRTVLLCIDLQQEHRRDSRYLVEGFEDILANVALLQHTARASGIEVFNFAYIVGAAEAMRPLHPRMPGGQSAFSDAESPLTAICPEVAPAGAEVAIVKTNASAFAWPALASNLRECRAEWLIIAGVWTEACVAATVKDAVDLGFHVMLVKDACGSGTAAMHETAILNLANRLYGGAVVDTERACAAMRREVVNAWQVEGSVPIRFTLTTAAAIFESL